MIDGHYHTAKQTTADDNRQDLDELAYGTRDAAAIDRIRNNKSAPAFDGKIDALSYLKDQHDTDNMLYRPVQGKALDIGEPALQKVQQPKRPSTNTVEREEALLPVIDFIKWFVRQHGVIDGMTDQIRAQYPDGVKESEYEDTAYQLLNPNPVKLKVI